MRPRQPGEQRGEKLAAREWTSEVGWRGRGKPPRAGGPPPHWQRTEPGTMAANRPSADKYAAARPCSCLRERRLPLGRRAVAFCGRAGTKVAPCRRPGRAPAPRRAAPARPLARTGAQLDAPPRRGWPTCARATAARSAQGRPPFFFCPASPALCSPHSRAAPHPLPCRFHAACDKVLGKVRHSVPQSASRRFGLPAWSHARTHTRTHSHTLTHTHTRTHARTHALCGPVSTLGACGAGTRTTRGLAAATSP